MRSGKESAVRSGNLRPQVGIWAYTAGGSRPRACAAVHQSPEGNCIGLQASVKPCNFGLVCWYMDSCYEKSALDH